MLRLRRVLLSIAVLCILFAMAAPAQKRVMTAEDVVTLKAVSNPQISPDGRQVVFVMSEADLKANESFSHLWMVAAAGGEPHRFTWSLKNESAPQWSPDGKWIAFISNREGKRAADGDGAAKSQIWIIPAAGGEAQQLTDVKGGVSAAGFGGGGYSWSPDSARIAFVSPEPASDEEQKRMKEKRDMIVVDKDIKMSQLWVIDIAGRQANQMTHDRLDATDPQWSPDGKQIAYVTRPSPKADDGVLGDIMVIPASGGTPVMLTKNEGPDASPRWSPDGRFIAYLAGTKPQSGGQNDILVMPSTGGQPRNLTEAFDRNEVQSCLVARRQDDLFSGRHGHEHASVLGPGGRRTRQAAHLRRAGDRGRTAIEGRKNPRLYAQRPAASRGRLDSRRRRDEREGADQDEPSGG